MLKRYPYWGWLLLAILLWCGAGYRYYERHKMLTPVNMTQAINEDLHIREQSVAALLKDTALLDKVFSDSLTEQDVHDFQYKLPVYVFAYDGDIPVFWSTNEIFSDCKGTNINNKRLLHVAEGIFLQQCITYRNNKTLTILIPVVISYPFDNSYLRSHFLASKRIPLNTKVLSYPASGSVAIKGIDEKIDFFVKFQPQNTWRWVPALPLVLLLFVALIMSVIWVNLITIHLARRGAYRQGLLLMIGLILTGLGIIYKYGFPFNVENMVLFSPRLYATNTYFSSLGMLLINVLSLMWVGIYVTRHTPYKFFFRGIPSRVLRYFIGFALLVMLVTYTDYFVNTIIRSLVADSNISFDVNRFYAIDIYTIVGLLTITVIMGASCLAIYILNTWLNNLVGKVWMKYILVALVSVFFVLISKAEYQVFLWWLSGWLLVYVILLDVKQLKPVADLLEPRMVFWAVYICGYATIVLFYFNQLKEEQSRIIFAEQHVGPQKDNVTEYVFNIIAQNIQHDKAIKTFFQNPSAANRKVLNERFDALYLGGQLAQYQTRVYLYDANERPLYNRDTISYKTFEKGIDQATPTIYDPLFYREHAIDGHYYLGYIKIEDDSTSSIAGNVFIDIMLKQATGESVYPELLQPGNIKSGANDNEYDYGAYINNKLVTQTNDYAFPVSINSSSLQVGQYVFYNRNGASELWYKFSDRNMVIIAHERKEGLELITLFCYLFGIQMFVAILIQLYQLSLSLFTITSNYDKIRSLTLRRRVHLSMLGVVLLSFLVVGYITIQFFTGEYEHSNISKLKDAMQSVQQSVQQYMKQEHAYGNEERFDSVSHSTRFKYFVATLANNQKIDINVFNSKGVLNVTSQDDIYDRALLSRIIRPDAYYQLVTLGKSTLIQNEMIGNLSYLSCYVPLRNDQGESLGYLNVPFFSSEKDLNYQISNIVVTLINLYAFIFLVSSFLTVLITRWITRSFNIIIKQFGRLNLQRNERIEWPYEDEIGMLVREYNNMVKKVEENAALLAESERESAWREMARQVAHEIKNPLTPMKLNIQYLQQALRNNHPNVNELVDKVTASLVEQMDNLSYIASEFSNFAKMPEARPEELDPAEILKKATELYSTNENLIVTIDIQDANLHVVADRSQLIRVYTNLLENAKQAIPEDHQGNISITIAKDNKDVFITIADNGIGMTEEVIQKIFQPYFTTKSSGTGLGLAMTKKIIEFWKGKIWFVTKEGVGTTFFISMPLV